MAAAPGLHPHLSGAWARDEHFTLAEQGGQTARGMTVRHQVARHGIQRADDDLAGADHEKDRADALHRGNRRPRETAIGELNPDHLAGAPAEQLPAGCHAEKAVACPGYYHRPRRRLLPMPDSCDGDHHDQGRPDSQHPATPPAALPPQRAKADLVVPLHLPGTRVVVLTHNPSIPPPTRATPRNAVNSRTPGTVPRARAQSGRVWGSPNRDSTLVSKRVIAQIWPPARANTITPFAWATLACGSRTYMPNAGWPLALVATSRNVLPGRKTTSVRNRATSSRPWYSSGIGGMVSKTSSTSRATRSSTAPVS